MIVFLRYEYKRMCLHLYVAWQVFVSCVFGGYVFGIYLFCSKRRLGFTVGISFAIARREAPIRNCLRAACMREGRERRHTP